MQKEKDGSVLKETIADFNMYCMDIPFTLFGTPRTLTERLWPGEDGSDVYVPSQLVIDAYTIKIKFGFKGDRGESNKKLKIFYDYMTGRDGSGVYMKIYCDFTLVGRRHVRFLSMQQEPIFARGDDGDLVVFDVELKVDDPLTDVIALTDDNGNITNLK